MKGLWFQAAVLAVVSSPAAARRCVGESSDTNYYPTINNSFPAANTFFEERMKKDNQIYPGERSG